MLSPLVRTTPSATESENSSITSSNSQASNALKRRRMSMSGGESPAAGCCPVELPPAKRSALLRKVQSTPIMFKPTGTNAPKFIASQYVPKPHLNHYPDDGSGIVTNPVEFLKSTLGAADANPENDDENPADPSSVIKPDERQIYTMDLATAVRSCDLDKIREFHSRGVSLDATNRFGESLIHMACRRGDARIVRFMIEDVGVNLHVRDDYGRTPLHDAVWTPQPNLDVMDILLRNLSDPVRLLLAKDMRGHYAFDYARKEHWPTWISFLKEREGRLLSKRQSTAVVSVVPFQVVG